MTISQKTHPADLWLLLTALGLITLAVVFYLDPEGAMQRIGDFVRIFIETI